MLNLKFDQLWVFLLGASKFAVQTLDMLLVMSELLQKEIIQQVEKKH